MTVAMASTDTASHYGRRDPRGATHELIPSIVKWFAILTIVLNFDAMVILLFNLFTSVPDAAATQFTDIGGNAESDSNAAVGIGWSQVLEFAQIIIAESGLTTWRSILFGLLVLIISMLAVVYIASLIMLLILSVAILLGCAPFFVLYLFNTARPGLQRQ